MAKTWSVNPLALAQLITGDLFQDETWDAVQAVLEKAFRVTESAQIFDSDGADPPRIRLLQDLAAALTDPRRLADIEQLPLVQTAIGLYGKDTVELIIPYLLPVSDAAFTPPGAPHPDGAAVIGAYKEIGPYIDKGVSYLDPVQGNASDCYLISAMSALAWSRPADWTTRVKAIVEKQGATKVYRYAFYRGKEAPEPEITVKAQLPVNVHGRPAYARSADGTEGWPPMLEKAFVVRQCGRANDEPLPSDYQYISDNRLKPQIACRALVGGASHGAGCEALGGDKLTEIVGRRCDQTRRVTTSPTMAWTWETTEQMRGLTWKATGLFANHAYTVLGLMNWKGREHVVLRNPWGRAPYCADAHATGRWQPGAGSSGESEVKLNRNGVFAIRADWFDTCFTQVGWVDR